MNEERGISKSAAKFVYHKLVESGDKETKPIDIVEENDLWLSDEWTHVGYCLVVCLENMKLVEGFKKGNTKLLEALIGKTIKYANMTVDAELIRDLMPMLIHYYWRD